VEWGPHLLEIAENQGNARGWGRLSAADVWSGRAFLNEAESMKAKGVSRDGEPCRGISRPRPIAAWSDIHRYAAFGTDYLALQRNAFEDRYFVLRGADGTE